MKKPVKYVLIALIAAACVIGVVYSSSLPMAVTTLQVQPQTAELYFTEQGVATVERNVEVYALVPGKIEELLASENQKVNQGDLICTIDSSDLEYEILQTQGSIKSYQAQMENLDTEEQRSKDSLTANKNSLMGELRALEAQRDTNLTSSDDQSKQRNEQIRLQGIVIAQNEKDLERAKDDLEKSRALYESGALSEYDYNQATKAVETQESLLAQNRQQLQIIESGEVLSNEEYYQGTKESLQAQIAGINSTLDKSYTGAMKEYYSALIENGLASIDRLNEKIEDYTVKASVSGIISSLYIKDTNVVSAQQPVAVITPDLPNYVEVYVSTNDLDEVEVGQNVDLILKRRDGDKTYIGEVKEIEDEAVVKISVLGVEERRVKVTVLPVTGADEIKKGFDVDVKFNIYQEENQLIVPKTAFFKVNDQDTLWIIRGGKATITTVVKGRELRTEFVVKEGLVSGDFVITNADATGLKEGAKVKSE